MGIGISGRVGPFYASASLPRGRKVGALKGLGPVGAAFSAVVSFLLVGFAVAPTFMLWLIGGTVAAALLALLAATIWAFSPHHFKRSESDADLLNGFRQESTGTLRALRATHAERLQRHQNETSEWVSMNSRRIRLIDEVLDERLGAETLGLDG